MRKPADTSSLAVIAQRRARICHFAPSESGIAPCGAATSEQIRSEHQHQQTYDDYQSDNEDDANRAPEKLQHDLLLRVFQAVTSALVRRDTMGRVSAEQPPRRERASQSAGLPACCSRFGVIQLRAWPKPYRRDVRLRDEAAVRHAEGSNAVLKTRHGGYAGFAGGCLC